MMFARPARAAGCLAFLVLLDAAVAAVGAEPIPADPPLRWWKGNLHTHTLWSDGDDFPEMVTEWYRDHDYNFLALSDHNVLSEGQRWMKARDIAQRAPDALEKYLARYGKSWVETRGSGDLLEVRLQPLDQFRTLVEERGQFLMIPSEEISDQAEGVPVHINAANLNQAIAPLGGATVTEAIQNNMRAVHDQAERAGREILAHLNHPNFRWAITAHDLAHMVLERHFEVYNGHPGTNQLGEPQRPGVERLWDIANTIRLVDLKATPLLGVANDDSHNYHGNKPDGSHPGRGWVMVRATHLTPEHIIRALKSGDFYASSGVVLEDVVYDPEARVLEISIAADADAAFVTQFIGTLEGTDTASEVVTVEGKKSGRYSGAYSDQIGTVLKTAEGRRVRYELTGRELYVRAVVTSSREPVDPSFAGQKQQAWTQPVGWESLLVKMRKD